MVWLIELSSKNDFSCISKFEHFFGVDIGLTDVQERSECQAKFAFENKNY